MKLRFAFTMLVFLLSATAFGQEANWWYEKYQKLGDTDPKWDALVREGIDHWAKAYDPKTGRTDSAEAGPFGGGAGEGVRGGLPLSHRALH